MKLKSRYHILTRTRCSSGPHKRSLINPSEKVFIKSDFLYTEKDAHLRKKDKVSRQLKKKAAEYKNRLDYEKSLGVCKRKK